MPYVARSITEFWRRWHMTLSAWLRDYLYIPLGGNRKGEGRTLREPDADDAARRAVARRELELRAVGRSARRRARRRTSCIRHGGATRVRVPSALAWLMTLGFVALCWIPFRAPRLADTVLFIRGMFTLQPGVTLWPARRFWSRWRSSFRRTSPGCGSPARGAATGRCCSALLRSAGARLSDDPISSWHVRLGTRTALGMFVVTLWALLVHPLGRDTRPAVHLLSVLDQRAYQGGCTHHDATCGPPVHGIRGRL